MKLKLKNNRIIYNKNKQKNKTNYSMKETNSFALIGNNQTQFASLNHHLILTNNTIKPLHIHHIIPTKLSQFIRKIIQTSIKSII